MAEIKYRVGEKLVATVRAHPIRIVVPLAFATLLVFLDFFLMFPLFGIGLFGLAIFVAIFLFAGAIALWSWLRWRSTLFLVTNQRVIDIDRVGLFRWAVTDVNYANISDISYEISGVLETVLNAGDVLVATQSGSHAIQATFVPDPGTVRETIMEQIVAGKIWSVPKDDDVGPTHHATSLANDVVRPRTTDLDPDDERAVARYADYRKKQRAMKQYFDDAAGGETRDAG